MSLSRYSWGDFTDDVSDVVDDASDVVLLSNPVTAGAGLANATADEAMEWMTSGDQNTAGSSSPSLSIEMPDYSAYYAKLAKLSAQANAIAEREVAVGEKMLAISQEQYDWWKTNYRPYEEQLIGQAKRGIDVPYAARLAGNRVDLAFKTQGDSAKRYYERLGTDTSEERLARIRDDVALQQAAARANASNNARTAATTVNKSMAKSMAALGNGVAAESLDAFSHGAKSLSSGAETTTSGAATLASAIQSANSSAADSAGQYYEYAARQNQASAQRRYMGELAQSNYNSWLYGTVGNTVGTVVGAGLAGAAMRS